MSLAPHLRMVVWPHKFWPHLLKKYDKSVNPAEFLQSYTTSILIAGGNDAVMVNYFPLGLDQHDPGVAHDPSPGVSYLLRKVVPSVYDQLRECLLSARQRDRPPRCAASPGGITVLLYPAVLLGSQHHLSHLQCFCCSCVSTGCEGREDAREAGHTRRAGCR
jgi:hypothetical protein